MTLIVAFVFDFYKINPASTSLSVSVRLFNFSAPNFIFFLSFFFCTSIHYTANKNKNKN